MFIAWLKAHRSSIIGIFILTFLVAILFSQLFFNLSTQLFDWHDYPLFVWIMQQNITHWKQLDIAHLYDGNIFHSFPNVLLFSDLFWPQSLVGLLISLVVKNPITIFNLVFFLTIIANACAAYYFWQTFTKNTWLVFFASLTTVISSFVLQNWYHFQIFSIWPFLLAWGYVLRSPPFTVKRAVIGGVLISILFYSSIYLWVFAMTAIGLWLAVQFLINILSKKTNRPLLQFVGVYGSVMILLIGYTTFRYLQTRQMYQAQRGYHEYVSYAGHLSDFMFPAHLSSLVWSTTPFKLLNTFNKHFGIFPGFTIITLATTGLLTVQKVKKRKILGIELHTLDTYMLLLLLMGALFSLGPRLSFNGTYLQVPLPYHLFLKAVPLFEVVRVTSRWSLFFFVGLTYFALKGIQKLPRKYWQATVITGSILFLAEVYPFSHPTEARQYYPNVYKELESRCSPSKVLLEYPMTEFRDGANISTNLSYRTQFMLASTLHRCDLVNGYTGYMPIEAEQYEQQLFQTIENRDEERFWQLLQQNQVEYVKLNKTRLFPDRVDTITKWFETNTQADVLYNDANYILVWLKHE